MLVAVLQELVTFKFIVLYVYFATVLVVHFRGEVRLPFGRHAFFAPYNVLMYLFSKVPSKPILKVEDFPDVAPLRDNWKVIRDEAVALYESGGVPHPDANDDIAFKALLKGGWERFYLKWYGDFMPSASASCPRTVELVKSIPAINAAAFTLMPPGVSLPKHRDPLASSLRYHLGLSTPNSDACRIWIDGNPYSWRDGEDIVFDETYVHWAKNEADTTRIILFCDYTRPVYTPVARGISWVMNRLVFKYTRSNNVDTEKPGPINRLAPVLYTIKKLRLRIKKANKPVYYVLEHALILGAVYLVFLRGFFHL